MSHAASTIIRRCRRICASSGRRRTFTGRIPAYPTGAAVCEVEVDPDTGTIGIRRYTSIDDAGQAINPLILHGQTHGGVAQGVGQALMEAAVYERMGRWCLSTSASSGPPPAIINFLPAIRLPLQL